jgi:uncharacterized protein
VTDLHTFTSFLKLCAGRSAQPLNLTTLGSEAGVTHNTARAWLSVLEASYLCFRVPSWHRNLKKQMIKAPKIHFFDTGLLCHLLGIRKPEELRHHPLRGSIFESWVASEIAKARVHRGLESSLFHYRDAKGLEVDLIAETAEKILMVETKSGATKAPAFFHSLDRLGERVRSLPETGREVEKILVFGGDAGGKWGDSRVLAWSEIQKYPWSGRGETGLDHP